MPRSSGRAAASSIDAVVGAGDGLPDALLAIERAFADRLHGGLGRQLAGRLAAHSIHHQEDAALGVDPVAVLVALAHQAGIGGGAAVHLRRSVTERGGDKHDHERQKDDHERRMQPVQLIERHDVISAPRRTA